MRKRWKILVVGTLAVSIATGSVLFGFAEKAEAGVSDCLAGILAGKLQGRAAVLKTKLSSVGMNVPVNSRLANAKLDANAEIASNISGQTQGFTVKRCIIEPLVTTMARALLSNFTAQTVKWINSGFKGSPLYVTNVQGFFADVADQAAGQFIEGLGPIGQILCSPFDLQLRLSLGIQYQGGGGYYQEIGCRLTDIQQNVQRAFTGGSFGENGWNNWIQLNAAPQNNPYGAYLLAVDAIDAQIVGQQFVGKSQLDWGKGFLSATDPETGEITTPGSIIEGQLNAVLWQPLQNVGLAKDLDAILNALVNQMINQVLGPGGLLGASRPSGGQRPSSGQTPGGGQSPVDRGISTTVNSILAANEQAQNLPNGLYIKSSAGEIGPTATDATTGRPTGPSGTAFCRAFKGNTYSADTGASDTLENTSQVYVKIGGVGADVATKKAGTPSYWNLADYNNVSLYCENVQITAPTGQATLNFNEQMGGGEDVPDEDIPDVIAPNNLALNKPVKQSSTYTGWSYYPEAKIAVDGQTTGNTDYGLSLTQNNNDEWWQVDLGSSQNIGTVKVYRMANGTYLNYPFHIFITTEDMGEKTVNDLLVDNSSKIVLKIPVDADQAFGNRGSNVAAFAVNKTGRYVRIAKYYGNTYIGLAEVEVIPAGVSAGGAVVTVPPLTFSGQNTETKLLRSQTFPLPSEVPDIVLTAGKDLNNLSARIKILDARNYHAYSQAPVLPVLFTMFKITMVLPGGDQAKDLVVVNQNCFRSCNPIILNPELAALTRDGIITFNNNFSIKSGETVRIRLTGTTSQTWYGSYKLVLEVTASNGEVLATYEKSLSFGQ